MNGLLIATEQTFWMPPQASSYAANIDWVFYFILYVSAFFFVVIAGCMFAFMVVYRRKTAHDTVNPITHNTPLEVAWSVLPSFILAAMFWWGYVEFKNMRTVPPNAYEVNVEARKWDFEFTYPNGLRHEDLHIVNDRPVRLIMRSQDVIHAAFIPAFRAKRDIVPGRFSDLWFKPTKVGEYWFFCAEYCGTSHSDMNAKVVVHPDQATFDDWLKNADPVKGLTDEQWKEYAAGPDAFKKKYAADPTLKDKVGKLQPSLAQLGEELVLRKKGCSQCHSVDGKPGTGPSLKGIWAKPVDFTDGTSFNSTDKVEWMNYIRESILEPSKKIVKGYGNNMAKIAVSDREIEAISAYIESLKE